MHESSSIALYILCPFFFSRPQVSALTGENVDEAFGSAVKAAIVRRVKEEAAEEGGGIAGSAETFKLGHGGGPGQGPGDAGCAC